MSEKKKLIHIVYNVNEHERIVNPILEAKPDKLYYFHHDGQNKDVNIEQYHQNILFLQKRLPKVQIVKDFVNYVDYYDIISKLARIISEERNAKITINMGTGSKMVALANLDAYRLWDIDIFYPYSLNYDPTNESAHTGPIMNAELPKFEFRTPTPHLIRILQLIYWLMLHDRYGHEKDHIRQKELQISYFEEFKVEKVPYNSDRRKFDSSQKIKLNRRLKKLESPWKLIYRKKEGRANHIYLTEKGEKMVKVLMNYNYGLNLPEKRIFSNTTPE